VLTARKGSDELMEPLFTSMQEIVIRTHDIDAAAARLGEIFDGPVDGRAIEALEGIELVQRGVWIGNERIAIVGDLTKTGPLSKALERRGEGVHEICVRTSDLGRAIAHFKEKGVRLTRDKPYVLKNYEYHGEIFAEVHIVFIHPESCCGVLVEVQEWHKEAPGTSATPSQ
jgi:methylmalonyl-CoA/ethylmalonyl-CoA epimerase